MAGLNAVVDLSHFNNVESFDTVKASGIAGVIHKATQGTGYIDSQYAARKPLALQAGLMWGAYHFGTGDDGVQQAEHFLSVVQPGPNDLMVLDFENNPSGTTMSVQQAEQFIQTIQAQTGRLPGFYSSNYFVKQNNITSQSIISQCWFWLALYGNDPSVPPPFNIWTLWQYTDGNAGPDPHSVNGIGNCDRDQFNGSLDNLKKLWGY